MDYKDHIHLIYDLEEKKRKCGIKLFQSIASNIINNPNNRKYKFLHYDKVYKKFKKIDLFIELLLESGFKKIDNPKPILVFQIKQLSALKQSLQFLQKMEMYQDESNSNNIGKDHGSMGFGRNRRTTKESGSNASGLYCICGELLIISTPLTIYGTDYETLCDQCLRICKPTDAIFHCNSKSSKHKYAYDLCRDCGLKKLEQRKSKHI